jgi:NAD(P)-dependent dehydrogenase (short-subunit alcohol dehydrogenase family)
MKAIFVTGASRGIGRAVCLEALKRGYRVHALVRRPGSAPEGTTEHVADIREREAVRAIIKTLAPDLTLFVANAGIDAHSNYRREDIADAAAETFDVNGTATAFSLYQMAHEWVKQSGDGRKRRMAVVSSLIAGRGVATSGPYTATKTAELVLAQALSFDLSRYGIGVSVIQPGFIDTDMTKALPTRPFLKQSTDAGRIIMDGLERQRFVIAFPFPMRILTCLKNYVPYFLYRWVMVRYAKR